MENKKTHHPSPITRYSKLWIGIAVLILLSPIGLILPEIFNAGGAWGEWGADELKEIAGYMPEGLRKLSDLWVAPVLDYSFPGWDKGQKSYIAYIISGLIGVLTVVATTYILAFLLKRSLNE